MAAQPTTKHPKTHRLLALIAVVAMLFTACGSSFGAQSETTAGGDDSGAAMDVVSDAAEEAMDDAMEDFDDSEAVETANTVAPTSGVGGPTTDGVSDTKQQTPAELGREIIFTATVNIGVDDVAASGAEATRIIQELDGFVFGQQTQGGAQPSTVLTFKVRPADFQTALERLGGIGELRNQSITTDDVTERVVDLQSRIQTTELGVERLRTAMEGATDLEDFDRLEERLLQRESDLEVLKGTLRTLRDRIDLATITLTLQQDRVANGIEVAFSIYEGHDDGTACPGTDPNRFEPGDEITLCIEAINVGDQALTSLNVTDTVLEIESIDDLTTVFGDPNDVQPGQSVMLAYELETKRDVNLRLNVTATPTDGTSTDAAGPAVRTQATPTIQVDEAAADPGFGDGFGAAVSVLAAIWTVAKVLTGFLIPLLILLPILWLLWFGARRALARRTRSKTTAPATAAAAVSASAAATSTSAAKQASPPPPAPPAKADEEE